MREKFKSLGVGANVYLYGRYDRTSPFKETHRMMLLEIRDAITHKLLSDHIWLDIVDMPYIAMKKNDIVLIHGKIISYEKKRKIKGGKDKYEQDFNVQPDFVWVVRPVIYENSLVFLSQRNVTHYLAYKSQKEWATEYPCEKIPENFEGRDCLYSKQDNSKGYVIQENKTKYSVLFYEKYNHSIKIYFKLRYALDVGILTYIQDSFLDE